MGLDLVADRLPIPVPTNCPDPLATDIEKYNTDVQAFVQKQPEMEAEATGVPLAILDTPAAEIIDRVRGVRVKLLDILREQIKLLNRRAPLLKATAEILRGDLVGAEEDLAKARAMVTKGLAKTGITLEAEPAFAAAPETAKELFRRKVDHAPAVRQAQAIIQNCNAAISKAATEASGAKVVAGQLTETLGKAVQKLLLAHLN